MSEIESIVKKNHDIRSCTRARVAAKKRERKLKKMLTSICTFALIGVSAVVFGAIGAVHGSLASAVAVVSLTAGSFMLGRYVEAVKR